MNARELKGNRTLIIIDDELFEAARQFFPEPDQPGKFKCEFSLEDPSDRKKLASFAKSLQASQRLHLHNIISHINGGNFFGLNQLIIYDLNLNVLGEKMFRREADLPQGIENQYAILIDLYSERDRYPTGMDIAEGLDQSPFADRIAWLSVTGNISSELKPYPLIRKREIPGYEPSEYGENERDTLFLWWGWLFKDFKLDEKNIQKRSAKDIVSFLRETTLTTIYNVKKVQEDYYLKSGKGARKGGLAGNILQPVLWRIHENENGQLGKITNAYLKIKGDRSDKGKRNDLNAEEQFNQFISDENQEIKLPKVYHSDELYYCMEKVEGRNFSDFIFEQIDFDIVGSKLRRILVQIAAYHTKQIELERKLNPLALASMEDGGHDSESLVLGYIRKIKETISKWVQHNKYFEPLVNAKTVMINNIQYYNAPYLCEILENTYLSRSSTYFPRESIYLPDAANRLREIDAHRLLKIHGDMLAQNIFVSDGNGGKTGITVIDPKGVYRDYLADYYKLFSSFSGQGHLEYLVQNPTNKLAHFSVNTGINPDACHYVCTPSIEDAGGLKNCQSLILEHIQGEQDELYLAHNFENNRETWLKRFLLGLASQYLCAPPLRDSHRFEEEMKFLYYRGVEILNEFFEMMEIFTLSQKVVTFEIEKTLAAIRQKGIKRPAQTQE